MTPVSKLVNTQHHRCVIQTDWWDRSRFHLALLWDTPGEQGGWEVHNVTHLQVKLYEEGEMIGEQLTVPRAFLQSIVDAAWNEGIKPSVVIGGSSDTAMRKHLEDMRAIVSKQLRVEWSV